VSDRELASARVRALLGVAAKLATPGEPLHERVREALVRQSGLSPEGVALALTEHVETTISDAQLDAVVAWAGTAPRCHVVLAANVPIAAVRALALALATSSSVSLRPSRRDPGLTPAFVEALAEDAAFTASGARVGLVSELVVAPGDAVHVYGRDETVRAIAASLPEGVTLRAHGAGLSIAVVEGEDDLEAAATGLARDVVAFDQRGCLSPRVALVGGGIDEAERLARALHAQLGRYDVSVPRGPLDPALQAALGQYTSLLEAIGRVLRGRGHAIGIDLAPVRLELAPEARVVHVASAAAHELGPLLRPLARWVTAVGLACPVEAPGPLGRAAIELLPAARIARLGELQRPPLDGPVDPRGG
jgi:acyl-CoA reductase-like NAD-dependent aldehyde dehydrogenase